MINRRIAIIPEDNCMFVDGELKRLPLTEIAETDARAIHWYPDTQTGELEYAREKNLTFTDEAIVKPYLDAWLAADETGEGAPKKKINTRAHEKAIKDAEEDRRRAAEAAQREKEAAFQKSVLDAALAEKQRKKEADLRRHEREVRERKEREQAKEALK